MKLISIDLKNFRQHLDTSVIFTDGVTGIIGPNGSGKSTILEAIAWALYGAPAVRGTNDTIRSTASEGGAKVNVALTFELGGSVYKVTRQLDGSGRSGTAVLEIEGRALRSGVSEVSEAVIKLLGMDYRAFFTSFFTGQKQIEFMAAMDGRARATAISKMLGYDRVTKARDQANEDRKLLNRDVESIEKGLPDAEELKERRKSSKAKLSDANAELAVADKSQKAAQEIIDKLKPLKEASDQKSKRFQEVSRRLELDKTDFARMSDRLKQLNGEFADLESKRTELESLKPSLEKYEQAKDDYKKFAELQKFEGERQRIAGQILNIDSEIKKLESRQKQLSDASDRRVRAAAVLSGADILQADSDKKLQQAREQQVAHEHGLQAHIKQLESQLKDIQAKRIQIELAGADGACPTCERPLAGELSKVLANFDDQIKSVSEQISSAALLGKSEYATDQAAVAAQQAVRENVASQLEQFRAESAAAEAKVAEYEMIKGQFDQRGTEIKELRAQLESLPGGFDQAKYRELQKAGEELRPVHDRAIALKAALERFDTVASEISELKTLGQARKKEIADSEQILAELDFSADDRDKLVKDFEESSAALNAALVVLERQRGEVNIATAILTAVERDEASLKSKLEELSKKRSERLHVQTVAEALDKLRNDLNDRIRPELEAVASELLSMMTDGRYNTLEISDSYTAMIRDDGELKPVISGGEEDIVNLALRLAISQMIADRAGQSFSLLVLDEVFGSLDDVRRDNVVNLLQNLKHRFEQIILITHVEAIHDAVDSCLWVAFDERTKTSSLVEKAAVLEEV
ncbi:MAG: SMC family ATPase [Armatimonadetes bacterium]|nr:SMC family ATPase [Armatimonadota bacterium]